MEKTAKVDWIELPVGTQVINLGSTLHDGDLEGVKSDIFQRTLILTVDVPYLRGFHSYSDETRFKLTFHGVESVRVSQSRPWPEEFSVPKGVSSAEQRALIENYQAKWREESLSWSEFEALFSSQEADYEILGAKLAKGHEKGVALRLVLLGSDSSVPELTIRAEELVTTLSDKELAITEFVSIGEAYWKDFSTRRVTQS